jgi:hypothetical protein
MYNRYRALEAAVGSQDQYSLDFIKETNAHVFITDRSFDNTTELRTIWHSIFDTTESSVQVSFHLRDVDHPGERHRASVRSAYYKFCLDIKRC